MADYHKALTKQFGTGSGFTGDEITGGTIRGELISARSITAEQVVSNFGQQMDIASNAALLLYATVDGVRPAGSVKTNPPNTGDSYILIKASTGEREGGKEVSPASIEIASGGEVNIYAGSGMYIATGGTFELESRNFTIDSDGNVTMAGTVTAHDGAIAGFEIGEETHVESGVTVFDKGYIRYGTQGIDSTEKGVYIGTDGINIVNDDSVGFRATADGTIYVSGEGMIAGFAMSHTNLNVNTLGASSFTEYTEGTEPDVVTRYKTESIRIDPGVWYRVETPIEIRIDFLTTRGVLISSTNVDENTNVMTPSNAYYAVVSCDAPPTDVPVKFSRYIRYLYAGTDTDPNHDTICVDSSTNGIYFGDDGLRIGSGIKVEANGDAEFAGKVTADTGEIAGLTLGYDNSGSVLRQYMCTDGMSGGPTPQSGQNARNGIYIGTDGINISDKFAVYKTRSGYDAYISGEIDATSGSIGGWEISSSHIGDENAANISTIGLSTDPNNYAFWAGGIPGADKFHVTHAGDIYATSGEIAGFTLMHHQIIGGAQVDALSNGNAYFGTNQISYGSTFLAGASNGYLRGSTIGMNIDPGYGENAFWAGAQTGQSTGNPKFYVERDGTLHADSPSFTNLSIPYSCISDPPTIPTIPNDIVCEGDSPTFNSLEVTTSASFGYGNVVVNNGGISFTIGSITGAINFSGGKWYLNNIYYDPNKSL